MTKIETISRRIIDSRVHQCVRLPWNKISTAQRNARALVSLHLNCTLAVGFLSCFVSHGVHVDERSYGYLGYAA